MPEDAGALLVRSGLIASDQLRIARQAQAGHGGTIGEHLVLAGVIDDDALADFYRSRLMVPQVKPEQLSNIPDWLITKIPAEMAAEFRCVPIACEADRHLTLAMADPSTTHAVDEISFFTGHYVVRTVATQRQIAWCLARYYGQVTPLAEKMMHGQGATRAPSFPVPGAAVPEQSGPARRTAGVGQAAPAASTVRGARPQPGTRPGSSSALTPPIGSRIPLLPTLNEELELSSPVPVVIESDRPEQPSRPPYIPPETREPMISFLHEETAPTGPIRMLQRPATSPPELYDRAGELEVPTGPVRRMSEPLPAVVISPLLQSELDSQPTTRSRRPEDWEVDTEAEVEYEMEYLPAENLELPLPVGGPTPLPPEQPNPIAFETQSAAAPTADEAEMEFVQYETSYDELDEVVLLDRPKTERRRHRRTRIGLGIQPSTLSRLTRGHAGLEAGPLPFGYVPAAAEDEDTAAVAMELEQRMDHGAAAEVQAAAPGGADWSASGPSGESIHEAARAAVEALRKGSPDVPAPDHRPPATGSAQAVPRLVEDEPGAPAEPAPAEHPPASRTPSRRSRAAAVFHGDELDDPRWGPPGSTIPPELLGPQPSETHDSGPSPVPLMSEHLDEERQGSEISPVTVPSEHLDEDLSDQDIDDVLNAGFDTPVEPGVADDIQVHESGPVHLEPVRVVIAQERDRRARGRAQSPGLASTRSSAPTPAEVPVSAVTAPPVSGPVMSFQGAEPMTPELVHELEDSSLRLVEILRELDQAYDRNGVVDTLIHHLSESHERVAFFVVKSGELATWKQSVGHGSVERRDGIKLSLDEPSTFQDIVGTRLPFRGPLTDPVSRAFVAAALGFSAGQMLALPVSVRGRVVGILYGDTEIRRVFEQHLAVVTRAAGVALERILRARKGL